MPGGLLQIASSGIQDIYLTKNPEITFFKKIYRRTTNFSTEFHSVTVNESVDFGDNIFISIPHFGDLIHKCFLKVEIPTLNIDDSYIKNDEYISIKSTQLTNYENYKILWKKEYDTLVNFSNIQILFYKEIKLLLRSEDISYDSINNISLSLRNSYSNQIKNTVFNIDEDILDKIDIFNYVINFEKYFGEIDDNENNIITRATFESNIDTLYNNILKSLKYYYSNYIHYKDKYNNLSSNNIKYSWIKNLGHFYFSNYNLEIDGQPIESYNSDYLNIYQSHNITNDRLQNYNEMIGNLDKLMDLSSDKQIVNLYIPLIFWFNRSSINSLPLVSMKNSSVTLKLKIEELHNLIYFVNYKKEFDDIKELEMPYSEHTLYANKFHPKTLWDSNSNISKDDIEDIQFIENKRLYIYKFKYITKELLLLKYKNLSSSEVDSLFTVFSSDGNTISQKDWINFRMNSSESTNNDILKLCKHINLDKSPSFADYNILRSKISKPKITLMCEYVYLDEIERFRFARNDLEYVITLPNITVTDIKNTEYFTSDMGIVKPTKDFYWFVRPKLLTDGFNKYSYKDRTIYNGHDLIDYKIIDESVFVIHNMQLVNFNYGENYYKFVTKYNKLNSTEDGNFYYYSFCLFPEEDQPSGSANFSVLKNLNLMIKINSNFREEYFDEYFNKNNEGIELVFINRNYNLLKFEKGKGKLVFY